MSGTLYIKRNGDNLELSINSTFSPLRTTTSEALDGEDEYSELDSLWSSEGNSSEYFGALSSGFSINIDSGVGAQLGWNYIRLLDSNDNVQNIELNADTFQNPPTALSTLSHRFFILTDQDSTSPATRVHFKVEITGTLYIKRPDSGQYHLQIADNSGYTNGITASSIAYNSASVLYTNYVTAWGSGTDTDLVGYSPGFNIVIDSSVYNSSEITSIRLRDSSNNVQTISSLSGGTTATADINITAPFFIMTDNNSSPPATRINFHITELCVAPFTKIPKIVEIKDVAVGDIIRTSRGDLPIAHIMKTQTTKNKEYVKFEKGCLAPNLPSDDFYVTEQHPLSLGFYKNELLNEGQYDDKEDDYIMLQMAAGELVGTIPGITKVTRNFGHYYNLVFDEHASIDMEGIDVCSHHPRTGPFYLPRDKYIDSSKINDKKIDKKITNPKFIRMCDLIIRYKPENIELKEFLASCLTSDLNKKRQLIN